MPLRSRAASWLEAALLDSGQRRRIFGEPFKRFGQAVMPRAGASALLRIEDLRVVNGLAGFCFRSSAMLASNRP
jgi:hypothetical protein